MKVTPITVGRIDRSTRLEEEIVAKFVYLYTGGAAAETPEAQQQSMQAWQTWFTTLNGAVLDIGNPFGAASTVARDGARPGGTSQATGYSIIEAQSLEDAADKAAGCPIIGSGGRVEVYDALSM